METPPRHEKEIADNSPGANSDYIPTDPSEIRELVRKQVEYYFSKENLQHDTYLTSQMDANMSVPISVIMKFGKIKSLTQDDELVKEALVSSQTVAIVDNRVKSILKTSGRSTIILRDIPSDTPEEEVRAIFAYDGCKSINSVRQDIENTWFVIMDSEEDAKDTMLDLKIKKRLFRGESVKCRLKTEAVVKSYYPVTAPAISNNQSFGVAPFNQMDMRMYGYSNQWQQQQTNSGEFVDSHNPSSPTDRTNQGTDPSSPTALKNQSKVGNNNQRNINNNVTSSNVRKNMNNNVNNNSTNNNNQLQQLGKTIGNSSNNNNSMNRNISNRQGQMNSKGGANQLHGVNNKKSSSEGLPSKIDFSGANFPPLATPDDISTPGYKTAYVKYSHDEILNIVKNITDVVLPNTIKPEEHSFAMSTEPNMDLLKRQRTFSIDETREQLRQGRAVQREAVVAGAVDYESMCYGDSSTSTSVEVTNTSHNESKQAVHTQAPSSTATGKGSWAGVLMKTPPAVVEAKVSHSPPKKPQAPPVTQIAHADHSVGNGQAVATAKAAGSDGQPTEKKENPKSDKKKNERKGKRRSGTEGDDSTGAQSTEVQGESNSSTWGGKPTFANIVKTAESSSPVKPEIVAVAPKTTAVATAQSRSNNVKGSNDSNWSRGERRKDGGSKGSGPKPSAETRLKANSSEPWGKEKLPPAPDRT